MYSGRHMRNKTVLLVGLSTVLLFFSIHSIPLVTAQTPNPDDQTNNDNSASQTQNSDPFTHRGSDNNINTGGTNNPSQSSDGSTSNNDGSKSSDSSTSNNHDDTNKGSGDSKSSDHKDNHGIPFP